MFLCPYLFEESDESFMNNLVYIMRVLTHMPLFYTYVNRAAVLLADFLDLACLPFEASFCT